MTQSSFGGIEPPHALPLEFQKDLSRLRERGGRTPTPLAGKKEVVLHRFHVYFF